MYTLRLDKRFSIAVATMLLAVTAVACGGDGRGLPPTQTPLYVVITDTPSNRVPVTPLATMVATAAPTEVSAEVVPLSVPFMCKAEVVEQTFQNGYMFWIGSSTDERCKTTHTFQPGTGEVWVIVQSEDPRIGEWMVFVDDWNETSDIISDPALEPTAPDLIQPIRGFGKVWREGLTTLQRGMLGYATAGEFKFTTDYRYDPGGFLNENGTFVPRPGMHTLVALGGERLIFDEQSKIVFIIGKE